MLCCVVVVVVIVTNISTILMIVVLSQMISAVVGLLCLRSVFSALDNDGDSDENDETTVNHHEGVAAPTIYSHFLLGISPKIFGLSREQPEAVEKLSFPDSASKNSTSKSLLLDSIKGKLGPPPLTRKL